MYHGSGEGQDGKNSRKKVDRKNGGGRMQAVFMTREMAIKLINPEAIDDNIFKTFYGQKILRDERRPLMWIAPTEVKHRAHPTAGKLNELVQIANDKKTPATRRTIKRVRDLGLISEDDEDGGREKWYYVDHRQFTMVSLVLMYRDVAPEVVRMQVADPYNPTAGIELFEQLAPRLEKTLASAEVTLPNGLKSSEVASKVYYNIIDAAGFPSKE